MIRIPNALIDTYTAHLDEKGVTAAKKAEYSKWLRYFLDFCDKYQVSDSTPDGLRRFMEKLREKNQPEEQRDRAADAVSLYLSSVGRMGQHKFKICRP